MVLTKKKLYSWSLIYFLLVGVIFIVLLYADKTRTESGLGFLVKNMEPGLRLLFSSQTVLPDESRTLISNRIFEELQGSSEAEAFKLEKDGSVHMSWTRGKDAGSVSWTGGLDQMIWNFSVDDLTIVLKARLSPGYRYPLYFLASMLIFIFLLVLAYANSTRVQLPQPARAYRDEYHEEPPLPHHYKTENHEGHPSPVQAEYADESGSTQEEPRQYHEYQNTEQMHNSYFDPEPEEAMAAPIVNDPAQMLFDSESGVSNGDIFPYRLKKELERASENAQDLSLVYLRLVPAEIHALKSGVKLLLEEFTHEDLIFRIDEATFALILPQLDFDQSIAHLEMLYRKLERLQNSMSPGFEHLDIMSGLSSRNGRLVEPDRLMEESRTALAKADRKKGRIVGFRPDPSKFRNYLKHTKV